MLYHFEKTMRIMSWKIVKMYFKTFFEYIIISFLLSICFLLTSLFSTYTVKKYAIILSFVLLNILLSLHAPMLLFFVQVISEMRKDKISCQTIVIQSIKETKHHTFYSRGSLVDSVKSVLYDTKGGHYHFIGAPAASTLLSGESIQVTYLPKTGFLLSVKTSCKSPNQNLIRYFKPYISS